MKQSSIDSKSLQMCREYLGKKVSIVVDQAYGTYYKGTRYEQNYGYVPGTKAPDGEGLDAYYIGPQTPLKKAIGHCIAIIHRHNDDDDKLVLVPEKLNLSDEEIEKAVHFRERLFPHSIIRK